MVSNCAHPNEILMVLPSFLSLFTKGWPDCSPIARMQRAPPGLINFDSSCVRVARVEESNGHTSYLSRVSRSASTGAIQATLRLFSEQPHRHLLSFNPRLPQHLDNPLRHRLRYFH